MKVLALDPGETVGVAFGQDIATPVTHGVFLDTFPPQEVHVWSNQLPRNEIWAWLNLQYHGTDIVVIERTLAPWRGMDKSLLLSTGVIEEWCRQYKVRLFDKQTKSNAAQYVPDKKLRRWGLYQIGKPHANDAMRHLIYYMNFGG